ncbi:hypothetical protein Shyhy01_73160 [Streptomyces hygroscopicus subsp. hygroscopicus]|nr:hypothetical protein Shyhy01_73160 [Streptomyces hygroscopicus subsp. hygroscopicus]
MTGDTATVFAALWWAGAAGAFCPACAVHTEAAAATAVTPTAAPITRPYHPRPACRAMSAPCSPPCTRLSCGVLHMPGRLGSRPRSRCYRSRTIPRQGLDLVSVDVGARTGRDGVPRDVHARHEARGTA